MSKTVTAFDCPKCGAPLKLDGSASNHECSSCASEFHVSGVLCQHCHQHHEKLQPNCRRCGSGMSRLCRRCYVHNLSTDEYCNKCGTAMDILDLGVADHRHQTAKLRTKVVQESSGVREATASIVKKYESEIVKDVESADQQLREQAAVQRYSEIKMRSLCKTIAILLALAIAAAIVV